MEIWAVVLIAVGVLAVLAGSGRFPGGTALFVLGLTYVWYGVAGYEAGAINLVTLAAFFRLGMSEVQWRKAAVIGVAVVATPIMMLVVGDEPAIRAVGAVGWLLAAVLFGEFLRNRRLRVERYEERARQAEAEAERRVVEERLRIARDLHDVLAHTISAMTVQAGVATDTVDRDPEATRRALDAIRDSGRDAIGEVRAAVAVLRSGAEAHGLAPTPRIDQVHEVADAARAQGLDVEVDLQRSGLPVPEVVELTVFRVVQEATTNVLRHAEARSMAISIRERGSTMERERGSTMEVEVRDDGRGEPDGTAVPGLGLRGMAERVESVGGVLEHGLDRDGGWVVHASLPISDDRE